MSFLLVAHFGCGGSAHNWIFSCDLVCSLKKLDFLGKKKKNKFSKKTCIKKFYGLE